MSRVGQSPIPVPDGVEVRIESGHFWAKGPLGELETSFPDVVEIQQDGDSLVVTRSGESGREKAFHGLARSLVANVVQGVSEGFEKALEIQGVGYRAQLQGSDLELQVGYSHPVLVAAPEGVTFEVPEPSRILVKGASKELVGQIAANVRGVRPPEPYKGKGIRYAGERVKRKVGKAGA